MAAAASSLTADELAFAGAARQAALIRAREVSVRELVDACLARIERHDPVLNAFRVVLADGAREAAVAAQKRVDAGEEGLLLGVPVAIKDDCDLAGETTPHGTRAIDPTHPAERDAEVVARLKAAGAIPIGKTNVPELELWPFTETVTYGATRNPWNIEHTCGGSSGGTGAAVAAGFVGVGLGSDGGGSVRIPAAACGVFGIKPQRDRIPLAPRREVWNGLSVNGALARGVEDAALFLDATADLGAGTFAAAARTPPADKLRIAVSTALPRNIRSSPGPEQRKALEDTAELLRSLGHAVVERPVTPSIGVGLRWFARCVRGVHDDAAAMPHPERLERRTRELARIGGLITPGLLAKAREHELRDTIALNEVFDTADVLMTPMFCGPPPEIGTYARMNGLRTFDAVARWTPYTALWNNTGQPAASLPAGFDRLGLPLAVQLVGRPGDETTLLSLAAQLEAERPWADLRPALL